MRVPLRVKARTERCATVALFLPSEQPGELFRSLSRLGWQRARSVYRLAEGYLITAAAPLETPPPGLIPLRAFAENLLLPIDADLVPSLLDDEAKGLVSRRGLVLLPGGRAFGFAPSAPLALETLLKAPTVQRPAWEPLPIPERLADRITEVVLDMPDETPESIVEAGGEEIGTEQPRPEGAGVPATVAAAATLGFGRMLAWLGSKLGMRGMAERGAGMVAAAMRLAPRLSEAILGRQEAALRALLRDFVEGRLERALRRALPLNNDPLRDGAPSRSTQLPFQDPRYSLAKLLGGLRGPVGWWGGNINVIVELERQYRKYAEEAARQGDHRRAAYIYGRLLRDYRAAANVLAQGGLHHDAAVLYESKVDDPLAAAAEWEAAGEFDRALKTYHARGDYELSGDLLRRLGEQERAAADYRLAAAKIVASGDGHCRAGEMLLHRAGMVDLAREYFETGWSLRPRGSAVPCAMKLAGLYVGANMAKFHGLLDEAEEFLLEPAGDSQAGEFFNEIARLADRPELAQERDDLRDRALMALAAKMRQRARFDPHPGPMASMLLGQSSNWAAALVSDAQFALRSIRPTVRRVSTVPVTVRTKLIGAMIPVVTAVCQAPATGDIIIGFESGEVKRYRARNDQVDIVGEGSGRVVALATVRDGLRVAIVRERDGKGLDLSMVPADREREALAVSFVPDSRVWLCPLIVGGAIPLLGLGLGNSLVIHKGSSALFPRLPVSEEESPPLAALLLPASGDDPEDFALISFSGGEIRYLRPRRPPADGLVLARHLMPAPTDTTTLCSLPVRCLLRGTKAVELAWLSKEGALVWASFEFADGTPIDRITPPPDGTARYVATAVPSPGLVIGVTENEVRYLRAGRAGLTLQIARTIDLRNVVACFAHAPSREILLVCADGKIGRLPLWV
jgi:tetratricopeptide (TPR) repeat protein